MRSNLHSILSDTRRQGGEVQWVAPLTHPHVVPSGLVILMGASGSLLQERMQTMCVYVRAGATIQ